MIQCDIQKKFSIAIHGGCGVIRKSTLSEKKAQDIRDVLEESIKKGIAILENGGSSLDAVEAAVVVMEDSPLFNAGKGAVYTNDERHELDASIMYGKDLKAGAVCSLRNTKNPIKLARAVIQHTNHVLISGSEADKLASQLGLEIVDQSYFDTDYRLKQLHHIKKIGTGNAFILDHSQFEDKSNKPNMGTVGAVALDSYGNLAAATSTGGMTNKRFGRIGDSPIIGAGTYANDLTCAVSCTGHGEMFLRNVTAFNCSALMQIGGRDLDTACKEALNQIEKMEGSDGGGLIAIDRFGNISMPFNTEGMYRASKKSCDENIDIQFYN